MAKVKKNRVVPIPKDTDILLTGGKHRGWMWKDIPTSNKQWYLGRNWWSEKKFKSMTDFEYCKYFIESNNKELESRVDALDKKNKELESRVDFFRDQIKFNEDMIDNTRDYINEIKGDLFKLGRDFDELSNKHCTLNNKFGKILSTIEEIDSLLLKNKPVSQFVPQPTDSSYQNGIYRTLLKNN